MPRRFALIASVLFVVAAGVASAAEARLPDTPPLDAKTSAAFDRKWQRLASRAPDTGARDIYNFLLTAVARNWKPENWAAIVALGEELHDRDPASPTYGNYRWYWREPKPNDRNALEFASQTASLAYVAFRDRLTPGARANLEAAFALSAEGLVRHKVDVSYTNIFLMRLANAVLIGEAMHRPGLVAKGHGWFDEWFAYTRANGIHEFSSPTYYGTDLSDLGALANFAHDPAIRAKAEAALRLFWTDIAANWFVPHEGIAGPYSRDYGFLVGHGYLDQYLLRAGWIKDAIVTESNEGIDNIAFRAPPSGVRELFANEVPRVVSRRWGPQPWERATHYVGHTFSLGTAGATYGAQDRILALTFDGGLRQPIVSLSLDYRNDPYGQRKMNTADGHQKLTHLLPFVASVQRGADALIVMSYDPARARNPIGGKARIAYDAVNATFVLPVNVALCAAHGPLAAGDRVAIEPGVPLFLRTGEAAAALVFVGTRTDTGKSASIEVVRDGKDVGAQRLTAVLAEHAPHAPVALAAWVRAAEGMKDDAAFDSFRAETMEIAQRTRFTDSVEQLDVSVPAKQATLHIVIDPMHERRITIEGADPAMDAGILAINGRDVGGAILEDR